MDILCVCISHHRRFPSFLGRFARPLHNTTQTLYKLQEGRALRKIANICEGVLFKRQFTYIFRSNKYEFYEFGA